MGKKSSKDKPDPSSVDNFEDLIEEALRLKGWAIPQTVDEVLEAEARGAGNQGNDYPQALADPNTVLRRKGHSELKLRPLQSDSNQEFEEHLARAARSGKQIPPEIEEKMNADRVSAENDSISEDES